MVRRALSRLRTALGCLVAALAAISMLAPARAAAYPTGFEERVVVRGLTGTTGVDYAPDGRAFIVEKAGRVKVAQPGADTASLLLDISGRVNSNHDRGLLGIALDSSFATNGYVYLVYTFDLNQLTPDSTSASVSRLSRIQVNPDGTLVNPSSPETILLGTYSAGPCPAPSNAVDCIPADGITHTIGSVRSGPDGTLWMGSGDAADFNTVNSQALRSLDEQSMAGKILHVDRDGRGLGSHPFCPSTRISMTSAPRSARRAFATPSASSCGPKAG